MLCEKSGESIYDLCKAGFVWLEIVTAQISLKISSVKILL